MGRRAFETASIWFVRLSADANLQTSELAEITALHERYRLDPDGLNKAQRAQPKNTALRWLCR